MDETEALGKLWPLGARRDRSGGLWLGGCAVSDLAREHGTPLYIFCEDTLRTRAQAYRAALQHFYPATGRIAYAAKACLNLAFAQLMAEEGLDLDVVSGGELYVALQAGLPPERIHFHGNNKSRAELCQALDVGVGRIVVDNFLELDMLAKLAAARSLSPVMVWLRLSTGILAHTHAHTQTGHDDTKFGFSIMTGDAERAVVAAMHVPGLALVGLHAHIGSQIFEAEALAGNARRLVEFAAIMQDRHSFALRELCPGGGWGVPMTEADKPAPIEPYVEAVSQAVARVCSTRGLDLPDLVLEPGRSMMAPAGVAVYRVGARKEIPGVRTYVSVDGGMADNIRPALYGARYTALAIPQSAVEEPRPETGMMSEIETVTIAGKFCESGDVLIRDIELPRLASGDLIALPMTGAYTLAMASNYNLATRPAVVMVRDGQARLVQRRETYADLIARDVSPRQPHQHRFRKYQALGNDYVVLDPTDWPPPGPSPETVRQLCDRHRGIGADGVLWGPFAPTEPFALRLFNPDGSEFEKSGNGLSIFARYLWDRDLPSGPDFVLSTPGGPVTAHVLDASGSTIGLEIGRISFNSHEIPVAGPPREVIGEPITVDGQKIRITAVTIGNPHCVVFVDDLSSGDSAPEPWPAWRSQGGLNQRLVHYNGAGAPSARLAQELGPILEHLPLFPHRTNVQFVRVVDRHTLALAIWERGAGYTLASGTSSCAAAGAAIRLGRCDSPVTVRMPGGTAEVQVAGDWTARITCRVAPVFSGELSQQF